jgi:hypothetical protein
VWYFSNLTGSHNSEGYYDERLGNMLHGFMLHGFMLHGFILHGFMLHGFMLHVFMLNCIELLYEVLF